MLEKHTKQSYREPPKVSEETHTAADSVTAPQLTEFSHLMSSDSTFELLLVEDNAADAALIKASLRLSLSSVEVSCVDRLSAAVAAVRGRAFGVVLLDLNLPDSAGVETFRRLADVSNGTPIVVLSGTDDSETAIEAVGAGADDYVQKSHYDAHTLGRCVRFAVERNTRRSAEQELLKFRSQLAAAQLIQDSLYPARPPEISGFDIASGIRSAGIGCGDYFDFIRLHDGRYIIVVGDVSGHGMASAIVMAETRTSLHTLIDVQTDPSQILPSMNRLIFSGTSEGIFVTLMMIVLDPIQSGVQYFNAGHPGWLIHRDQRQLLTTHQLPLGLLPDLDYSANGRFAMVPGDILVLPTDGIAETRSGPHMFGNDRLLDCIDRHRHRPALEIVEEIFADALGYAGGVVPEDDMTIVVLKAV